MHLHVINFMYGPTCYLLKVTTVFIFKKIRPFGARLWYERSLPYTGVSEPVSFNSVGVEDQITRNITRYTVV